MSAAILCFLALLGIGWWCGRDISDTSDLFLSGRRIPGWAAALSLIAAETSIVTVIGVPALGFRQDWSVAKFFIGSAAAKLVVAFLLLPSLHRSGGATIYDFLGRRFGPGTRGIAAGLFFLARILGSGARFMAACVVAAVLMDWRLAPTILLCAAVCVMYSSRGGIRAAVWTNAVQAAAVILSAAGTLIFLSAHIRGGLPAAWAAANGAGSPGLLDWGTNWSAAFGFFGSLAVFGADQELLQRFLAVGTEEESRRAMVWSVFFSSAVLAFHLLIGTGLYAYYAQHPELPLPQELDKVYMHFAVQSMPMAFKFLVFAAVFMVAVDLPLVSLATSFIEDVYRPLSRPQGEEGYYMFMARVGVVVFGIILAGVALLFGAYDGWLPVVFKIGGAVLGPVLGVFLLGLSSRRVGDNANALSLALVASLNLLLLILSERGVLPLDWNWLAVLGTLGVFGFGWVVGRGPYESNAGFPG